MPASDLQAGGEGGGGASSIEATRSSFGAHAEVRSVVPHHTGGALIRHIEISTRGSGLHEITSEIEALVRESGLLEGLCTTMIQHTSASLVIQENADPSARHDLEGWMQRQVPEGDSRFTHTAEGADDMPSHIRAALTATSLSIPFTDGRLALGTWQGIFLWEHRARGSNRRCVIHLGR
jgi:secondary thiamine-phosphate synthase enzyme